MTEEIYNKATCLRSIIKEEKKVLKYWQDAIDATEETITLSDGQSCWRERTSIFRFISFKELKDMLAKYIIGKDDECEYHSTSYRVPKSEFEKEEL